MATLNVRRTRDLLQEFNFQELFIEELGWSRPDLKKTESLEVNGIRYPVRRIAELSGVTVFETELGDENIPDAKTRALLYKHTSKLSHENLLIIVTRSRTQSVWYWGKREGTKTFPRDHYYLKGQPGDLFLSKLSSMVVDISELDEKGEISVLEVASRLKKALDVEATTKKFYKEYDVLRIQFVELIDGIDDERKRKWYASVLLNRLMFIYFLQRKLFIDGGNEDYLSEKLQISKKLGKDKFYSGFLQTLFFKGFALPEDQRSKEENVLLGKIKYLNGGLFLPHPIEEQYKNIRVPDTAFEQLFLLFSKYSWNLNDTPGGKADEINPDVLGYIFEKYINQKEFGAYYTRPEITDYLSERTIAKLIVQRVNAHRAAKKEFTELSDLLLHLDAPTCTLLLKEVLPSLSILDPACGSGAFLVAAMKTLINIYSAVIGKIEFLNDHYLTGWLKEARRKHRSINYFIKKQIITNNLYGVDIMEEATEIAKLRLFLALVAAAQTVDELEPLPNVDFNILAGNSLVGLMTVNDTAFEARQSQGNLFLKSYHEIVDEKNRLIRQYRNASTLGAEDLRKLRDSIDEKKQESIATLNVILMQEFADLGVKYEEAVWDSKEHDLGKPKKRALKITDITALQPFHWGFEFDEIMNNGGFDAIITNPPWEIFKPQAKEFFAEHSELVTKKKMDIKSFEKEMSKLLKDADIRTAWMGYLNQFPHVSAYFRSTPQYRNQISVVDGKKTGSDINLYKLFTEQCVNLLKQGGECGIVIPSGIYTDLGAKQLRVMLFGNTTISGLFCFENRKTIFENVDSRFKFVVLTFEKGGTTTQLPAAFMRHDVAELERFPGDDSVQISIELVKKLSPDSYSIMEFKSDTDITIAKKMLKYPLLGEEIEGVWNLRFTAEFHMTNDSHLFKEKPAEGRLPLYEGKMIWQYDHRYSEPRYWVDEKAGRKSILGSRKEDRKQPMDYQSYRLGFRDIAANTNERSLVSTIIPPSFHGNKIPTVKVFNDKGEQVVSYATQLYLCGVWNSFVMDWFLRMKITTTLNFFYLYQLPIPILSEKDKVYQQIILRTAKLICTTPEYDTLAKTVGLGSHKNGITESEARKQLSSEIDGIVAHHYGLTEDEFAYILTTFPIVPEETKKAALQAYREVKLGRIS